MRRFIIWTFVGLTQWGLLSSPIHAADIIVLTSGGQALYHDTVTSFRARMPSNLDIDTFDLEGRLDRAQEIGERIRASHPQLVFAVGLKAALVSKSELPDTPILFSMVVNPEEHGLPTANMVGIRHKAPLLLQLEHIHTLAPKAQRIGLLYNEQKTGVLVDNARAKTKKLSLQLVTAAISQRDDLAEVLQSLLPKIDLLWILQDATMLTEASVDVVLQSTLRQKIPVFTFSATMVKRGALGAMVISPSDTGRQAAHVAQALLKQQGPSTPALLEPEHPQLALNLNTAEFLGLTPAPSVVQTAGVLFGGPGDLAREERVILQDFLQ